MNLLFRAVAVLLLSSVFGILLRKNTPELALLLSIASVCFVFLSTLETIKQFRSFLDSVSTVLSNAEILIRPVLKCLAIAITTRVASELCRDASQGAASSALEFMGTVCALSVAMPLILSLVRTIGALL